MRAGRVLFVVVLAALAVYGVLAFTGKLPPELQSMGALASAWTAASSDAGPATEGGVDAAVKARAAPLSSAQLTAPFFHNTFIATCGAPPEMKVTITVTVKAGRAVDVLAKTDPPDPGIAVCIENATKELRWDASRRTGKVTVTY